MTELFNNKLHSEERIETVLMCYYFDHDLDWIEKKLYIGRDSLYRWIDKVDGLERRGW